MHFLAQWGLLASQTSDESANVPGRGGAGSALHPAVLISAGVATFIATTVALLGIVLQLKNYRKPILQRMVVRIMIMVPLYAISSLISLFSLDAAFAIDAIRDIYEAFVIYAFFNLMINYLGGERSLLILLYGRPPKHHVFPVSLFKSELDASDPFTFLFLKRGILQYVQVKPILAIATLILKATGTYKEGELSWSSGYLYVSFIYNGSICLSLYCLAMFWVCVNADIKPFRPVPKFLCVKGILFFSFWQALGISALVAAGIIRQVGPYTDAEHISLAITDTLICYEMPFFAFAHWFAFSHTDYIDKHLQYAARMPFYYAFRDAFGFLDVLEDSRATLRGGVSYRTFEPVEGGMHQGIGRERRIKAGLRYARGGQKKYWIPMPHESTDIRGGPINAIRGALEINRHERHGYAPLLDNQTEDIFHDDNTDSFRGEFMGGSDAHGPDDEWLRDLEFDEPDPEVEEMFAESRELVFGDYHYPCIDVSGEEARRRMWDEEERILKDQRAAFLPHPTHPTVSLLSSTMGHPISGYGATNRTQGNPNSRIAGGSAVVQPKGKDSGRARTSVYGGWAEEDLVSTDRTPRSALPPIVAEPGTSIIDHTPHEPMPGADPGEGDVTLRYTTKVRPKHEPSKANRVVPSAAETSPQPPSPSSRPPVTAESHLATTWPHTEHVSRSSISLPPDAIDLVVEDRGAEAEKISRERRKGDPAVGKTGGKIYRREYVANASDRKHGDAQGEVEEDGIEPAGEGRLEVDRDEVSVTREDVEYEGRVDSQRFVDRVLESDAGATPSHTRGDYVYSRFLSSGGEDNPWAS